MSVALTCAWRVDPTPELLEIITLGFVEALPKLFAHTLVFVQSFSAAACCTLARPQSGSQCEAVSVHYTVQAGSQERDSQGYFSSIS